jgi:hypothetical protein
LWTKSLAVNPGNKKFDFENILRTIFLKSYNTYSFENNIYKSGGSYYYPDYYTSGDSEFKFGCARTGEGIANSFCAVYPVISNINLYYGDTNKSIASSSGWVFTVPSKWVYRLEFNSDVDAEQQPLTRIIIDWGDNKRQTITGEDEHSDVDKPHVFYHYYSSSGSKAIKITITDNWGAWDDN